MTDTTTPADTFAVTTANGIPMLFVLDREQATVRYYDRRYAGKPGWPEHGQGCGPAFAVSSFSPDATHGIRGWHEIDVWDLDAATVRRVGNWLKVSGFGPDRKKG